MMSSVSDFDSTFFAVCILSRNFVFCVTAFVNCVDSSSLFPLSLQSTIIVMSLRRV